MVFFKLEIKADLENVKDLAPASDDFIFHFQVKCNHCNEIHPKLVTVNRTEQSPVSGGKNSNAHFVWRCGFCKRESSAKFPDGSSTNPYSADRQWASLLTIECRGLEFVGFDPTQGMWRCLGAESDTEFSVEFDDEACWADYDEKSKEPVGVASLESRWTRA